MSQDLRAMGFPGLAENLVYFQEGGEATVRRILDNRHVIPLWIGCGECVRATFCTGVRESDGGVCNACRRVATDPSVKRRLERARKRGKQGPGKTTRDDYLTNTETRVKVKQVRKSWKATRLRGVEKDKKNWQKEKDLTRLRSSLANFVHKEVMMPRDMKMFCADLSTAVENGSMDNQPALRDILSGEHRMLLQVEKYRNQAQTQKSTNVSMTSGLLIVVCNLDCEKNANGMQELENLWRGTAGEGRSCR